MGNSLCHTKKKKQQTGSQQISQTKIEQPHQINNNQRIDINKCLGLKLQKQAQLYKIDKQIQEEEKVEEEEDEEDEVEEPQVPNQNNEGEQNLNVDVDAKVGEIKERINLNIIPRQEIIQLTSTTQTLPVIVQLQTIKNQTQHIKPYIDLICVVDVSGSMIGEKINLIKDSLRYLQKILGPNDRISIITFDANAEVNLQWTRNTPKNKQKIKKAILGMTIRDSTNIASGVNKGLEMIKNRKYKNPVTCMFVLSDGKDNEAGTDDRIAKGLYQYDIQDTFEINTFGFGANHDPKIMNNIANMKGGSFTFIDNIKKVAEYFILSMSGMMSVLAKDVKLYVQENPLYKIQKIYGDDFLWKQLESGIFQMNISYLHENDSKEFALLLEMPSNQKINLQTDIVLSARADGNLIDFDKDFHKQEELKLSFSLNQIEYIPNELVEVAYLRAKSGAIIGEVKEMAINQDYDKAQQHLNKIINEIEQSQFMGLRQLIIVLQDLQEVKQICKPQLFEQKGVALMLNKQKNHIQKQQSVCNSVEWNSDQEEYMDNFREGLFDLSNVEFGFNNEEISNSFKICQLHKCTSNISI